MTHAAASRAAPVREWRASWELAWGTVQGRDHWLARRNAQDAVCTLSAREAIVVVVADGCGASPYSETGARLLASLLAPAIVRRVRALGPAQPARAVDGGLAETLDSLAALAGKASVDGRPPSTWIGDHLLATALVLVVTPRAAAVARVGDGVVGVNGNLTTHTSPGNAPAYAAYRLLPPDVCALDRTSLALAIEWEGPSRALQSVVLATDGAAELPAADADPHAALRAWLADDLLFARPLALGRRLAVLARAEHQADWERQVVHRRAGVLRDDTTVALLRRRAEG